MSFIISNFKKARLFLISIIFFLGCQVKKEPEHPLFEALGSDRTGLDFKNNLNSTPEFNMFKYMYFYNGAGVGVGDFNNDGLPDIFFASNQGRNKIYLNEGHLKFKDVTDSAQIPNDGGWSTGVSVVDINNDGLLDIYICRVGNFENLKSKNQLLICQGINKNGIPVYKDEAAKYGLDFSGFGTQAVFFDYDMDGDLDCFLLNHSIHQNGSFAERKHFLGTYHPLSGDRIYRNDGGHFTDVTRETGINSSMISYGLGIAASDINLDGYPDLYVGNDFHENDYLYINQKNGTFKDEGNDRMMHTSRFTMGVDVADINNDAYPDIISMDMLSHDPYILKRSLGEDEYLTFYQKINYGYNYQYSRNNLQLNRRNGMFSEVGMYSNVYATDWSWAPLWLDFDNDGLKDLFISNGIPKRLNDIDYINYVLNENIDEKIRNNKLNDSDMELINKFPRIMLPKKFYRNKGNVSFDDEADLIKNNKPTFSNGAAYADFDNDGDMDIVVNNIDDEVILYENKSNDGQSNSFVQIKLRGPEKNINALGSKVVLFTNQDIRTYEKYPVHGFESSMEVPLQIGLKNVKIDSSFLIWPDNTYQPIELVPGHNFVSYTYKKNLPAFNYKKITEFHHSNITPAIDITNSVNLNFVHKENQFNEFDREPLIPHMVSREGPAIAVGDINGDGLDDIFIGSSKGEKKGFFIQNHSGKFIKNKQPALDNDSTYEDVDACFADVNNDGFSDLIVASGGNEYYGASEYLQPRVYLNNKKGVFTKLDHAFDSIYLTASCVVPYDFNNDGYVDLFIGGRAVPWAYGEIPKSYLLQNDGTGKFKDVTDKYSKELSHIGFVTNAVWLDLNKDGRKDLVVTLEWGGIYAFLNNNGSFTKKTITDKKGWWNFILPCDINNDGNIDFIAGNLGLNTRLKASEKEPVRMYYYDFDGNGKKDQVLSFYLEGKEIVFNNKEDLERRLPYLKKKFLYAKDFAKASLEDMFSREKLIKADTLTANYFENAMLINDGHLNFSLRALPWQAQLTTFRDAVVVNANNDSLPDILLMGNFYENNIEMGRYDADFGTMLINSGRNEFQAEGLNGLVVKGQVRHIRKIQINNTEAYVLVRNNDSTMVIEFNNKKKKKEKFP